MRSLAAALLLASSAAVASDVPFYLRGLESPRDVSGINENFRSVVNDITKLREDVDATSPSGSAILAATQTFTGGNTFSGPIITSGQIHNASATVNNMNLGQTWTATTFGVGIAGSTLAFTTTGGAVVYNYTGACNNNTTNETAALAVYQDGVLVSPQTTTLGVIAITNVTGAATFNCSFSFFVPTPSAALHTYWMSGRVSAGTGSLVTGSIGRAWIEELK